MMQWLCHQQLLINLAGTIITLALAIFIGYKSGRKIRGHRIYLCLVCCGLPILACTSGGSALLSPAASEVTSQMRKVCLRVLIGPSLACISMLRLFVCIMAVTTSSASKAMLTKHTSSSSGLLFHLSLGPVFGLASVLATTFLQHSSQLVRTFDGIEAFWDFGCCLLYISLRIQIQLVVSRQAKKMRRKSVASNVNGENVSIPKRPRGWRLVGPDGYLLSVVTSLVCRSCLVLRPLFARNVDAFIFGFLMPCVIALDIRSRIKDSLQKLGGCCLATNTRKHADEIIYVTTASRLTQSTLPAVSASDMKAKPKRLMPRSATFSGRCALGSILSAAPSPLSDSTKPTFAMSKTKTWCGPLDDAMLSLVGEKCLKV